MFNQHNCNHQPKFSQKCIVHHRDNHARNNSKDLINLRLIRCNLNHQKVKNIKKNDILSYNQYKKYKGHRRILAIKI